MVLGPNFETILEAARLGIDWAWVAIYRELAPAVSGYLRARGAAEPDDLAGEVFLHLVRDLPKFEGTEPAFRSWVFTIAHHRLIDDRRRRGRRREEVTAEKPDSVGGDVEEEALHNLRHEALATIIKRLSSDQADVLLLRILGGLTVEEVATVLGKRPGAVKALQRRGLAAIRREIVRKGVSIWETKTVT